LNFAFSLSLYLVAVSGLGIPSLKTNWYYPDSNCEIQALNEPP